MEVDMFLLLIISFLLTKALTASSPMILLPIISNTHRLDGNVPPLPWFCCAVSAPTDISWCGNGRVGVVLVLLAAHVKEHPAEAAVAFFEWGGMNTSGFLVYLLVWGLIWGELVGWVVTYSAWKLGNTYFGRTQMCHVGVGTWKSVACRASMCAMRKCRFLTGATVG